MDRILRTQLEKIRKFLYSQQCKSFLVFLFFLFVSASFWMLQTLNETLEMNVRLPLQLLNVPKTAVLTRELPEAVDVRLSDKGSVLVQYLYRKKLQPLMLDFANYDKGNVSGRVVIPHNDVIRLLQPQLIESSKVQSINPDTIDYYYTRGLPSRLPVKVKGIVKTTAQNYLSALHCYPDSVEVYAPASVMDTMKCAYTSEVVWEGLTETVTREVGLYPIKGVKYMTPKVKVKAQVDYYVEKTVEVAIVGMNFPADKVLRTFPSKAKVTFRVGAAHSERKWEDELVLMVTYDELQENSDRKYRLRLKSRPECVSHIRISPAEVDYLIEHAATENDG